MLGASRRHVEISLAEAGIDKHLAEAGIDKHLAEAGIDKHLADRARKALALEQHVFEAAVAEASLGLKVAPSRERPTRGRPGLSVRRGAAQSARFLTTDKRDLSVATAKLAEPGLLGLLGPDLRLVHPYG